MSYSFPLGTCASHIHCSWEPKWYYPHGSSRLADSLSIIANIISVIGAVEGLRKTLEQIINLSNAPDEVFALISEVSDFDIVLKHIEKAVTDDNEAMAARRYLGHLPRLIEKHKTSSFSSSISFVGSF